MNTQRKMSMKWKKIISQTLIYGLLIIGSVIMIFPLFWMLSTALKDSTEVFKLPMEWWPENPNWGNFVDAFTKLPFGKWTLNTVFITVMCIIGNLISCTLVAYGFARYKVKSNNTLFMLLLSTMMLPSAVTMIPVFFLYKEIGWVNTFLPLIVPAFFGSAFYIFMLRQFFLTIPLELEDAARMDGLGTFGIIRRIIIPLTLPALTTVAIFVFNGVWNDFMGPLLYLNKQELYTLALGINFFKSENTVQWNYLMAASFISMIPSLIIFAVGQKKIINGISLSAGIK